jgi:hypothetical protein
MVRRAGGGGIGVIVLALVAMYFGVDPSVVLNQGGGILGDTTPVESGAYRPNAEEDDLARFVAVVLADTEETWNRIFTESGRQYREPKLVLFSGSVESACGMGQAAMGPFYCPGDMKAYIDLSFYQDLKLRHQAPGDFAQAYVIAHEIGHQAGTAGRLSRRRLGARCQPHPQTAGAG